MKLTITFILFFLAHSLIAQILLKPDAVFDGKEIHKNWVVLVEGNIISYAGIASAINLPKGTKEILLKGMTLLPGIIEGHSHLLLHPYDETSME